MKKCPFCGANIEDSARFCLYCMQSLTKKEQILPTKKKPPQWLVIIAAVVVLFFCVAIVWFGGNFMSGNEGQPDDLPVNPTGPSNQTEPSNTELPHVHGYYVEKVAAEYQKEAATCILPATYYYTCACGEKGSETFYYGETAPHTIVTEKGYPATCSTPGLADGMHCSVCDAVLLTQTPIPVTGHTFDDDRDESCNVCKYVRVINCNHSKTVALAAVTPTCTTAGLTEGKKCALCEEILVAQTTLTHLGHTEVVDQAVAATCTTAGKTEGKHCGICNAVLVKQVTVAAKGHTEVIDQAIAATCTTTGKTEGKHCATCNVVLVKQTTVAAKGHTEVIDQAIAATCTTTGKTEGKHCSVCDAVLVKQTTVAAKGHAEVIDQAIAATCTTAGKTEGKHCSICNTVLVKQTTVAAKGHAEAIDQAVAATCTTAGKTEGKHCSRCQTVLLSQQDIAAKGHVFDSKNPAAPCSVCGAQSPHTHSYSVKNTEAKYQKTAATCAASAVYYYSCSCGEQGSDTFSYGETGDHIIVTDPGYPATCDTPGLSDGTHCSVCHRVFLTQDETKVLGHTFRLGESPSACLTCGAIGEVIIRAPQFPIFLNDTFRIDSCTYVIRPSVEETWEINFTVNYTNISSDITYLSPEASLYLAECRWGYAGTPIIFATPRPNESGSCEIRFRVPNFENTYDLIFR